MAGKGANYVVHSSGLLCVTTGHEFLGPAHNANWQPSPQSLSVADYVGLHIIGALSTPRMKAEACIDLIKDEDDSSSLAGVLQFVQPFLVASCWANLSVVAAQHGVAGRRLIEVKALKRIHKHSCNFTRPHLNHCEGQVVHVLEAEDILWQTLVASNRLHAIPPTMVRAAEGHTQRLLGVETSNSNSAHHSFCARHVERNLVVTRNFSKSRNVVEDSVVQRAQKKPLLLRNLPAVLYELLVLLVAAYVDTVGARDVHGAVAIKIHDVHTFSAIKGHGWVQIFLHNTVEGWEASR
mmetsp:Transcript_42374/g.76051  ORF Transcript_42374/g.76051 Transcript_42374/m.76051 type:complete len:294 (+) Transcript_42374:507-1388(+)